MDCARLTRLSGRLGGPVSFGAAKLRFAASGGSLNKRSAGFVATQGRWRVDGNGAEAYAEARRREREGPAVTWLGALHSNTIDLTNDLHRRITHAYSFRQRVQILRGQSCSHDGVEAIPSL